MVERIAISFELEQPADDEMDMRIESISRIYLYLAAELDCQAICQSALGS